MKKSMHLVLGMMLLGSVLPVSAQSQAREYPEFQLSPIIVSATRSVKKDVDVPMSTTVVSGDALRKIGTNNLQTSLAMMTGINYKQFGPSGGHMGSMMSEVSMRGIKNGTLVMINGSPINLRGKYYLDSIPVEQIERVEVIKGGGSVLHGSEAMAGTINIITKNIGTKTVSLGFGNFGQRNLAVSVGDQNFSLAAHQEKWGRVNNLGPIDGYRRNNAPSTEKKAFNASYHISDELSLSYNYSKSDSGYEFVFGKVKKDGDAKIGDIQQSRIYTSTNQILQLNYEMDGLTAKAYLNKLDIESTGPNFFDKKTHKKAIGKAAFYHTKENNRSYGLDIQKKWNPMQGQTVILGGTYQNEYYDKTAFADGDDYSRHNYALYTQWENKLTNGDTLILSGRETWTGGAARGQNFRDFSAAGQYIHPLSDKENLYVNISQSFIMPTFAQMYGASERAVANPDLRPQKGINYEVGYKRDYKNHSYRIALYHTKIKDNIKVDIEEDKNTQGILQYSYTNADFKNTGLEAEMTYSGDNEWSYHVGLNLQNPQSKESGAKAKKPYWDRVFGKIQVTGGVTYHKGSWTSTFSASYLGSRVGAPSSKHSAPISPYLLTVWNTTYRINDNDSISLRVDNFLDRDDNLSNSGTIYYATPRNYLLTYKHKF